MLRAVIVEDEMHSRETLKNLLRDFCPRVEVCGAAGTIEEAVPMILSVEPDLLFLDIELQNGTGFDLLRRLPDMDFDVVFTTAFDQYAIQAIKFSSLDYLLKPIDIDELQESVAKALEKQNKEQNKSQLEVLMANLESRRPNAQNRICLATADGLEFLQVEDILYCEANGSYTNFHLRDARKIVVSKNLKEYENLLDEHPFMRVHNSFLINLREVQRFVRSEGGYILMKNNAQISISPKKRDEFLQRMASLD
jgi:two-component system, LytTR family, response regulator